MIVIDVVKKRNNVLVAFNNQENILIPSALYTHLFLAEEDVLTEEQLTDIKRRIDYYNIKQNAYRYLSGRNHSKYELKTKLLRKKYDKSLIESVISDLENLGYLNDEEFALNYFKYQKGKSKGFLKIKSELIRKGIDRNILDGIEIDNKDLNDFYESAKKIANKKYLQLSKRNIDKSKILSKIYQSLLSKGFTVDIITEVMNDLKKKGNNNEV